MWETTVQNWTFKIPCRDDSLITTIDFVCTNYGLFLILWLEVSSQLFNITYFCSDNAAIHQIDSVPISW